MTKDTTIKRKKVANHFHVDEDTVFYLGIIKQKLLPENTPARDCDLIRALVKFFAIDIAKDNPGLVEATIVNVRDGATNGNRFLFNLTKQSNIQDKTINTAPIPTTKELMKKLPTLDDVNSMMEYQEDSVILRTAFSYKEINHILQYRQMSDSISNTDAVALAVKNCLENNLK